MSDNQDGAHKTLFAKNNGKQNRTGKIAKITMKAIEANEPSHLPLCPSASMHNLPFSSLFPQNLTPPKGSWSDHMVSSSCLSTLSSPWFRTPKVPRNWRTRGGPFEVLMQ